MHRRSARRSPRTSRAIGAAIEKLEPRRMLCLIGPDGTEYHFDGLHMVKAPVVEPKIPKNSKLDHDLHDPAPLQDVWATPQSSKPLSTHKRLIALSAGSKTMGPQTAAVESQLAVLSAKTSLIGPQTNLVGSQPLGTLSGKVVFTSGGHGYTWTGTSWNTQRGLTNGMVEDMGTQDQMSLYADYLLNAGATVVTMRPVGHQLSQVIVDNSDAGFSIQSGSWSTSTGAPYWSNNSGNDAVHYQFANTALAESAVARWTPSIPSTGFYPVYAWWTNSSNRSADATYRINYTGGSTEVRVDQAKVGKGWVYLGTYYFASGSSANVELSNKSATTGKVVIADAIRFGNGMGDFNPGSGISGQSREDEESLYWLYRSRGYTAANTLVAASTVDGGFADDNDANVGAPIRWGAYMNDSSIGAATDRVYLGFHSNAFDTTARGALGLTSSSSPTPHQNDWATKAQAEIQNDLQGIGSPPLESSFPSHTAVLSGAYGEINNGTIGGEFDATIIEVAFHDNASDAAILKDPKARDWIARAEYQATVKYFNTWGGTTAVMAPDVPTNVRATTDAAGNVILNWTAPAANATTGGAGAATGYKIYSSTNGYGFSLLTTVGNVTTYTATGLPNNAVTYFQIVATNAGGNSGGDSKPSFTVAAKPQVGRRAPILIVNNFDRMDRPGDDLETSQLGGTATNYTYSRVRPRYNNSHDYSVQAASAIVNSNSALGIETATDAAIAAGQIVLSNYHTVIWMSGEQSAGDGTFTSTTQPLVTTYLNNGGKMFISGSEIGWDLVAQGNGSSFFTNTLHSTYASDPASSPPTYNASDDAGTYTTAAGIGGTALAGVPVLSFDNGSHGTYDVDYPDQLGAGSGATVAMNYSTGSGHGAVIQYASGNTKTLYMGFPFESIYTASQRNSLMSAALTYFGTSSTILSATPGVPDLLPVTDSGDATHNADNRTNDNNSTTGKALQFQVTGTVAGATVTIYNGATVLGSAVASGTITTVTTNGSVTLTDGAKSITAKQTESGKAESPASTALSITIDTTAPAAPGASSVSSTASSITLDWSNNPESDFYFYDVYRANTSGGPYTKINGANITSSVYTDSTVTTGSTYYYVIRATDIADNTSGNSAQATATAAQPASGVPTSVALSGLTDSGVPNDNLTNYNNASPATAPKFIVTGAISGATVKIYADGNLIGSIVANASSMTFDANGATTLAEGARSITATQLEPGKDESAPSPAATITIDTIAPATPATPSASTTTSSVTLDWADNTEPDLRHYQAYRGTTTGGDYTNYSGNLLTSDVTETSLTPGTHYFYILDAVDNAGNKSAFTAEVDAPTIPLDPGGLVTSATGGRSVNLNWTLPGGSRDDILVERRLGNGSWIAIATLAAGATGYIDNDPALNPNTLYGYQIRAHTGSVYSNYTAESTATTYKFGDIDGNGTIDFDDYFFIDYGFANKLSGWHYGDFNADGVVNQLDYNIIDNAFYAQ